MPYEAPSWLLETFRYMVNKCIDVGLEKGITSRYALVREVYHELRQLGLHSWYALSAIEVATAILKNYRKAKRKGKNVKKPRAKKLMAKIGNQAITVVGDRLRVPLRPRQYIYIPLQVLLGLSGSPSPDRPNFPSLAPLGFPHHEPIRLAR